MKKLILPLLVCALITVSLTSCSDNYKKDVVETTPVAETLALNVTQPPTTTASATQQETTQSATEEPELNLYSNSISKINLQSSDEYIESIYPNNAYHPKLIDMGHSWRGYRYWISYTPYPNAKDYYENPHIVASNDLINYSEIKFAEPELTNHKKSVCYNSDSHLVYNSELDRLELFWRYTDYDNEYMCLYMRYSTDGNNWSDKTVVFETCNNSKEDMISPTLIYENGIYKIWYENDYRILYREFADGVWSSPTVCNMEFEDGAYLWHLDVIRTERGYEFLGCACTDKNDRRHMNLYYSTSDDGINWSTASVVISPSSDEHNWDGGGLYRATFIYSDGIYYVLYSGRNDYDDFGTGLLFGKDMYSLRGTDLDYINDEQKSAADFWRYIRSL